ncbi:undecaprenyl-diphosphatase [Streptomyces sp. DvalAA-14]|uniref:bifunctional phosphatase PAP2/diacylglycerol kinase family protein n=1 Tax=unclassified Streptomyces TaxID=2593676 RepID=UPI00081B146C|nr:MULTISPECIES: bifunctional phosphatase PAP2/diacylglycerol kinase family protein [unclassified Streptomyces]MYS20133.1 phosphatase PAP2 family protein [Streptomyces sp. SID4948]SCD61547.1 undecaprenyl-diphosphatase [Streptomyces sp. DvalAA-14]
MTYPWKSWDKALFARVAKQHWPGAEPVLPRLSRSANHGRLWFAVAAGMAATGGRSGRRAAARGLGSMALASLTANTVGKGAVRRTRPILDAVPVIRQLHRQPVTSSFPSGHSASAAAFVAGAAMESSAWGTALAPVAASVAFSRIYTGVHYPSDVVVGCALGVGAALTVRALLPPTSEQPEPGPSTRAPVLAEGEGLHVVVNTASGPPPLLMTSAERIRTVLPQAEVVERTEDDDLVELLEKAARSALEGGGALGVCGGDGTVGRAAEIAMRHELPLAVFPGGTRNHFALDLGFESVEDTAVAVLSGRASTVDVARHTDTVTGASALFLNTFSVGSYPELVRIRERWSRRVGSWPASVLAAVHVLRTCTPVDVVINGKPRSVWLLFAGNCRYSSWGPAPVRRRDLSDGVLDVRIVDGGPFARTRMMGAALTGVLTGSPVYEVAEVPKLRLRLPGAGVHLAYDGEVAPAPGELVLDKVAAGLVVYRS